MQSNLGTEIEKVSLHHHVKTKSLIQTCKGLCGILVVYSPYTMVYWWYTGGILMVYWWYTGGILVAWYTGGILVANWWYTGGILVVYWWQTDGILALPNPI